jgi:hypothetical protein
MEEQHGQGYMILEEENNILAMISRMIWWFDAVIMKEI